jgi:hypothetical protein
VTTAQEHRALVGLAREADRARPMPGGDLADLVFVGTQQVPGHRGEVEVYIHRRDANRTWVRYPGMDAFEPMFDVRPAPKQTDAPFTLSAPMPPTGNFPAAEHAPVEENTDPLADLTPREAELVLRARGLAAPRRNRRTRRVVEDRSTGLRYRIVEDSTP